MFSFGSRNRRRPTVEQLDARDVPALIASQQTLVPPLLTTSDVAALLDRAAVATQSNDAIIAVVDRNGTILGVRVEGGVDANLLATNRNFAINGAVAEARTAALFANDTAPLTSRTIQEISQSTITQREVESNPDAASNSTAYGPGFVAPIGAGGHFPPNVDNAPQVDLFEIEHTNRDSYIAGDGTAFDFQTRFDINPAFIPAGQNITPPLSYGDSILSPANQINPAIAHDQSRGIGTLPGGIPLYKFGTLVGGIGVFFPGTTGFADAENSILGANFNSALPDRSLEAEFIAVAAAGGSKGAGVVVGALSNIPALPGFDIPFPRIDLGGVTLDTIGPGGIQGPQNLIKYAVAHFNIGGGANTGTNQIVTNGGATLLAGKQVPYGWLVTPHASADPNGLTAAQVTQIIQQGINTANLTRAQIRTPQNQTARMVFAVADSSGDILGLYRMPDATVFSIDVAVAKARNTAYYDDATQLQPIDQLPGVPAGASFSNRTFRYLAAPRYPISVQGSAPGFFSSLNDPNIDRATALQTGPALPASAYHSILLYDSFHPGTNFHAPTKAAFQNGIVFFPGSAAVYVTGTIRGGFGVSGDGVDQDDFVTSGGIFGYDAPEAIKAYNVVFRNVRLPFRKDPRNPTRI